MLLRTAHQLTVENDGIADTLEYNPTLGAADKAGIVVSTTLTFSLNGAGLPGLVDGADASNYVVNTASGTFAGGSLALGDNFLGARASFG